jgi:hypothetical protein
VNLGHEGVNNRRYMRNGVLELNIVTGALNPPLEIARLETHIILAFCLKPHYGTLMGLKTWIKRSLGIRNGRFPALRACH